jgi:hypothetical protein
VVLPCCFSTALILFPICTSLTFDIKNAWNLFLAWVQGIPRPTYQQVIPRRTKYGIS